MSLGPRVCVGPDDIVYGSARRFEQWAEAMDVDTVRAYRTIEEAEQWFGASGPVRTDAISGQAALACGAGVCALVDCKQTTTRQTNVRSAKRAAMVSPSSGNNLVD